MVSCCKCGYTRGQKNGEKVTFHHFPNNAVRRKLWIDFVGKPSTELKPQAVLCSKHFPEEFFDHSSNSVVRLKEFAVPSIEVARIKNESRKKLEKPRSLVFLSKTSTKSSAPIKESRLSSKPLPTASPDKPKPFSACSDGFQACLVFQLNLPPSPPKEVH